MPRSKKINNNEFEDNELDGMNIIELDNNSSNNEIGLEDYVNENDEEILNEDLSIDDDIRKYIKENEEYGIYDEYDEYDDTAASIDYGDPDDDFYDDDWYDDDSNNKY